MMSVVFRSRILFTILCTAMLGCSGSDEPQPDGATTGDGGVTGDSGVLTDAQLGPVCKPGKDGKNTQPEAPACGTRGAFPGPHLLDSAYCVVAAVDAPAAGPFGVAEGTLWFLEPDATADKSFTAATYPIDMTAQTLGTRDVGFAFKVETTDDLYAGSYLALSSKGEGTVGYTLATGFAGALLRGSAHAAPVKIPAKGNFDVIYWDDDTLLINGLGVGTAEAGQGVYLYKDGEGRKLIDALGTASGPLVRGEQVLFAGGFFEGGNQVFAFSACEVQDAIDNDRTLDSAADGDQVLAGSIMDAAALGDDLIYIDDDWTTFKGVKRIPVEFSGNIAVAKQVRAVVTAASQDSKVIELQGGRGMLGLRLSAQPADRIVLIRQK